jgi:hypothetical protein
VGKKADSMKSISVNLTDAQIKALPTTPIQILPAPGAGKMQIVFQAIISWNFLAGAYTASADASFQLLSGTSLVLKSILTPAQSILQNAQKGVAILSGPYMQGDSSPTFSPSVTPQPVINLTAIPLENLPLVFADTWGGVGNYTGGNAANTMKIQVFYDVVDI